MLEMKLKPIYRVTQVLLGTQETSVPTVVISSLSLARMVNVTKSHSIALVLSKLRIIIKL